MDIGVLTDSAVANVNGGRSRRADSGKTGI